MSSGGDYSPIEAMVVTAARGLPDRAMVFVGTGLPLLASTLAQKTHAPNLVQVFEAGGIAPLPIKPKTKDIPILPISVGDSRTTYRAVASASMAEGMEMAQKGLIDYAILGGAQIDMYGNLNSTVIGDFLSPTVRFPGSGGANDFASFCWKTIIIAQLEKRRFVPKLDFITTPGYIDGCREAHGLPPGSGPYRVFTDKAVMDFQEESCRMRLHTLLPGYEVEDIVENTGFEVIIPDNVRRADPPTAEELRMLREDVDPQKIVLGR